MNTEVVVALIGLVTSLVGVVAAVIGRMKKHVHHHEHVHIDAVATASVPKSQAPGLLSRVPWLLIPAGLVVVAAAIIFAADEFQATITKIETKDSKTTISGKKGNNDDARDFSITVAKDAKVIDNHSKIVEGSDKIENLKNKILQDASQEHPIGARIITNDKGEVTQILVGSGKKKKTDKSAD